MSIAPILRPRVLVMFAVALILSVSAYGFAAANTFSGAQSGAGDGVQAISGYDVTNVAYTMDASSPSKVTSVSFSIAPVITGAADAANAKIKLFAADSYHTCDLSTPGTAICAVTGGVLTSLVDNLSVVASS